MNSPFKDYINFEINGLTPFLSDQDKIALRPLIAKYKKYSQILEEIGNDRTAYTIDIYPPEKQVEIFNLKDRIGKDVCFKNSKNSVCFVDKAELRYGKCLIEWHFVYDETDKFHVNLDRFLKIYSDGEFHDVYPKKFAEAYLTPLKDKLDQLQKDIENITNKYKSAYKRVERNVKNDYYQDQDKFDKIEQEVKTSKTKNLTTEEAIELAMKSNRIKNYWTNVLTPREKAYVMGWICKHIYSIRIYGLENGRSGNTLKQEFGDSTYGEIKYREPKKDEADRNMSVDNIVGHISFKNVETAPEKLLRTLTSKDGVGIDLFKENRLNSKNLALFLIANYHNYGFKAGIRNLANEIDYNALMNDKFVGYESEFQQGYNK